MKLKYILMTGFLIVALIPALAIAYSSFYAHADTIRTMALDGINRDISSSVESVNLRLKDAESDVLFLSGLSSLKTLINSDEGATKESAKLELQQDFLAFSKERGSYYQLRYIDENGMEVVRVDSEGITPHIIPENELQNKKGRYYFDDAMSARSGTVFVSPLDLNIEHGELENRGTAQDPIYVPMIRYSTPLFDNNNNPKGIVITNVYADHILTRLHAQEYNEFETQLVIVNKDGFYLHHSDEKKEFGFMHENDETVYKEYSSLAPLLFSSESHEAAEEGEFVIAFTRIYPSGEESLSSTGSNEAYAQSISKIQGKDYYWVMASISQTEDVFIPLVALRNNFLLIVLLAVVVVSIASFYLSRFITQPIEQITTTINDISRGKLDTEIDPQAKELKNEIGDLARAFDRTLVSLKMAMKKAGKL